MQENGYDPWVGNIPWRNGNPVQYSCSGNPMERGAWWAAVHNVARVGHNLSTKQQQQSPARVWEVGMPPLFTQRGLKTASGRVPKPRSSVGTAEVCRCPWQRCEADRTESCLERPWVNCSLCGSTTEDQTGQLSRGQLAWYPQTDKNLEEDTWADARDNEDPMS